MRYDFAMSKNKDVPKHYRRSRKLEIRRQLFHIALGILLVFLIDNGVINAYILAALVAVGLVISFQSTRQKIPVISWFLKRFERPRERRRFPGKGALFYLIGSLIVVILFPKDIALASIMVLALGDSVSHFWGSHFGQISNPLSDKKFLEGSLAGFAAGFLGAVLFVSPFEAAAASLTAMAAEAIEVKIGLEQVDDNLIVPFVAGAIIWVVRILTGTG